MNDPGHVSQAEVPPGVSIGKLLVVKSHEGQQSGMQIVDVHLAVNCVTAEFIRPTVGEASSYARAGQEHGIAGDVMVAAIIVALRCGKPAKLGSEQHQRVLKQAALAKVGKQSGRGLINSAGLVDEALMKIRVMIPSRLADLDKAHTGLAKARAVRH